jgi:hypothetical protein
VAAAALVGALWAWGTGFTVQALNHQLSGEAKTPARAGGAAVFGLLLSLAGMGVVIGVGIGSERGGQVLSVPPPAAWGALVAVFGVFLALFGLLRRVFGFAAARQKAVLQDEYAVDTTDVVHLPDAARSPRSPR